MRAISTAFLGICRDTSSSTRHSPSLVLPHSKFHSCIIPHQPVVGTLQIIAETGENCVPFCMRTGPPGVSEALVIAKLSSVGFDDKMMGKSVNELSGGWRMKLAIGEPFAALCVFDSRAD